MTCDLRVLPIFVVITVALVHIPSVAMGDPRYKRYHPRRNPLDPYFRPTPNNVTFAKGEEAVLQCAIENRGTKTIVWRKKSQDTPITIGRKTFIPDGRFKVIHKQHSLTWNLHIEEVKPNDSGIYECQVSTKGRNIRQTVELNVDESTEVIKPKININGTFFMEKGQTLRLVCNASGSDYPPDAIDWFKDGSKIKSNGRVTLTSDVNLSHSTIVSILSIRRGVMGDAGTYVCRTSDLQVTSAKVNILNTDTNNEKREYPGVTSIGEGTYEVHTGEKDAGRLTRPHALVTWLLSLIVTSQIIQRRLILT